MMGIRRAAVLLLLLAGTLSPIGVPLGFLAYHIRRTDKPRQFNLRFLLAFITAEAIAIWLALSLLRWIATQ